MVSNKEDNYLSQIIYIKKNHPKKIVYKKRKYLIEEKIIHILNQYYLHLNLYVYSDRKFCLWSLQKHGYLERNQ